MIEDDDAPVETEEEEVICNAATKLVRTVIPSHPPTQNDDDILTSEQQLDRLESAIEMIHREQAHNQLNPVAATVKESQLLENFRYILLLII